MLLLQKTATSPMLLMRTFIFFCTLFVFKFSFAQQADRKYFFKEVGWTLIIPAEFKIADSTEDAAVGERGKKAIEETNDIKIDISQTKTLITVTKNTYNYFNCTITPFDPKTDGNYEATSQIVKDMLYKTFSEKMPEGKIDSISTQEKIDGLGFDKFRLTISLNDKILFNMFLLSKYYRGYDFGISYLYMDDKTKEQIESMLRNSRFTK